MFICGLTRDAYLPKRIFARCILHAAVGYSEIKFYSKGGLNFKISRPKKLIQKENPRFVESFLKPFEFAF